MRFLHALSLLSLWIFSPATPAQVPDEASLIQILQTATDGYKVVEQSREFAALNGVKAMQARIDIFDRKLEIKGGPNLRDWLFTGMQNANSPEEAQILTAAAADKKRSPLLRLVCLRALRKSQATAPAKLLLSKSFQSGPADFLREWQQTVGALLVESRLDFAKTKNGAELIRKQLWKAGPPFLGMASFPVLKDQDAANILTAVRKSKSPGDLAQMIHVLANFDNQNHAYYLNAIQVALAQAECGPRIAVAESAVQHRIYQAIPYLIDALETEAELQAGRYANDYASALRDLTGQQFGNLADPWWRWWSLSGENWIKKVSAGELDQPETGAKNPRPDQQTGAKVFGIPVDSKRIAIVMDGSGSMNDAFGSRTCAEAAADELETFLAQLPGDSQLQLYVIVREAKRCFKKSVKASTKNQAKIINFVRKFDYGQASAMYDVLVEAQFDPEIDTIVFISDGGGSWGSFAYPGHMLEGLKLAHQRSGVRIHTICVGKNGNKARFMQQLADITHGRMRQPSS
jgi:VWA domain-containing protein